MVKEEQIPLRSDLDRVFKPIFDQYPEDGGVPLTVLRDELIKLGATENIPRAKIDLLVQKADEDQDGMLDYSEFVKLMTESEEPILTAAQLTKFQRMLRVAVSSVVPPRATNKHGKVVVDDYVEQYNCRPPPLFMPIISIVELAIFIYYVLDLKKCDITVNARSGVPMYSPLIYNPCKRYEAWRFLTYMFIHQGYIHIISNLIFQLVLGIPLEIVHKAWRIGIVYSCGVIAGCLCHSVFDVNVFLAGASGGCYAMIGAHLANIVMNWSEMTKGMTDSVLRFLVSAPVQLTFWILFASIDFGFAVYQRYQNAETNVGYAAHLGGAVVGLLIGIPVLKNIDVKPWEKIIFWIALIIYLLCVVAAVLFNWLYKGYPNSCPVAQCEAHSVSSTSTTTASSRSSG